MLARNMLDLARKTHRCGLLYEFVNVHAFFLLFFFAFLRT